MYMLEDMIDIGLRKRQKWPTKAHRDVAVNLAICNPMVRTMDDLMGIVAKVRKIPKSKIKTVKWADLPQYGLVLHASAA